MSNIPKGYTIGQFTIVSAISRGGMAEIFEAVDKRDNRKVILKIGRNDIRDTIYNDAIRKEAMLLGNLSHFRCPGIVQVQPISYVGRIKEPTYSERALSINGQPWYYVMELLSGGSLAAQLEKKKILPLSEAATIGIAMANVLEYLHHPTVNIAHLDIKPENIMFRYPLEKHNPLEPVLIDFGVAALQGERASGGTLPTMSPEYIEKARNQVAPEMQVDLSKVDIYALGVVMYKMVTGKYPFSGWGSQGLSSSILKGVYKPPTQLNHKLPSYVDDFIALWMNRSPAHRPSLGQIRRELSRWQVARDHLN